MRAAEINKWIKEGGDLPEGLTKEEKEYLEELGWKTSERWFDNGQKHYVYNYLNGQKHGKWEGWFENGQRSYVESWINGQERGKWEEWFENGQKHYEMSFICGMEHDTKKEWDRNGKLTLHEEYYYGNRIE